MKLIWTALYYISNALESKYFICRDRNDIWTYASVFPPRKWFTRSVMYGEAWNEVWNGEGERTFHMASWTGGSRAGSIFVKNSWSILLWAFCGKISWRKPLLQANTCYSGYLRESSLVICFLIRKPLINYQGYTRLSWPQFSFISHIKEKSRLVYEKSVRILYNTHNQAA